MSLRYVIDGYNLICHPLYSLSRKKSDSAPDDLLLCIRNHRLTGSSKNAVTIVFDGYPPRGFRENASCRVIFSRDESADEYIKRLIEKAGNPRTLVVVSDDREIAFFARSYHAQACSADKFFAPLKAKEATLKKASKQQEQEPEPKLGYSQMHKINEELRRKWLH